MKKCLLVWLFCLSLLFNVKAEEYTSYDKTLPFYVPEEEIHARHILVDTEKQAKDLIVKLKAGAKFEDLANKLKELLEK